jgi:hypothetical protein
LITLHDLDTAIAKCQGEENPNAQTCIKLAAFYTIQKEMFGKAEQREEPPGYSYAPAPAPDQNPYTISLDSETDFARVIEGRDPEEIMPLMDEAMTLLQAVYPACYNAIMKKLSE